LHVDVDVDVVPMERSVFGATEPLPWGATNLLFGELNRLWNSERSGLVEFPQSGDYLLMWTGHRSVRFSTKAQYAVRRPFYFLKYWRMNMVDDLIRHSFADRMAYSHFIASREKTLDFFRSPRKSRRLFFGTLIFSHYFW
jgi:hypothetical protein